MKTYELSFANINILSDNIAEVIINDGVEMDLAMVDEYHAFLLSLLTAPFSLLINKLNKYSYDPEALREIATLKEINLMAVVSYSLSTTITTDYLTSFPRDVEWNLKIFGNRDEALSWLNQGNDNT